jgi:phosphatidylglycerol:prolipoprotein diacylglycerol transferase
VVCITYGVGRFIDEFWREPDFGQPLYFGWMSKGQLLTIPMILIGFVLAVWRSRIAPVARDACDAALESRSGDNR